MITRAHRQRVSQQGFSLVELMLVTVIISVMVASSVPQVLEMVHVHKLNNATRQFSGLLHNARQSSVRDSNAYSVYFVASEPITEAFVGVKGSMLDYVQDPLTAWSAEVAPKPAAAAPATSDLETTAFLRGSGSSGSDLTVFDGYVTSGKGITFSAMGSPCVPATVSGARVCNTSTYSTNVAYWIFFQNSYTGSWQSVTVTPAGKIQRWTYHNGWVAI
jgi:prepilin-type N-terminal cleavage/methylation domain-containing protein